MADNIAACYIIVLIISFILALVGFLDIFKQRQAGEPTAADMIARQLRGIGYLILAMVVMGLGATFCLGYTPRAEMARRFFLSE